jgi:hypothetical protein
VLGDFNAKAGREDIFKLTIGNENLHKITNGNEVGAEHFATSKNLTVKSTIFPHCNINKYTWTSPNGKTQNQIVGFEVFTAVTRKNAIFWDLVSSGLNLK